MKMRSWYTPAALAVLISAFYSRLIFTPGAAFVGDDLRNFFYPLWTFAAHSLRAGNLPLWNPHQFAGVSLIADPEIALFYPPNWILLVLPVARGLSLLLVLHVWWAAWGMARLVTRWGASVWAALLAGLIYATGGWLTAHLWAGHYTFVQAASWLPWLLLSVQPALERGTVRAALPATGVLALTLLAGFPPIMVYVGLLVSLYTGFHLSTLAKGINFQLQSTVPPRPVWERGPGGEGKSQETHKNSPTPLTKPSFDSQPLSLANVIWQTLRQLGIIALGAALLTAIQTLPVLEFTAFSQRGTAAANIEFAGSFPLPAAQLLALIFPDFLGSPIQPAGYWGSPFYEELSAYTGLWALVALALVLRTSTAHGPGQSPARPFLLATTATGALLSLGLHGGLYLLLLEWLPPLRLFRVPGRYLLLVTFGLAGLAALALTHLQSVTPQQRREWLRPVWRVWLPACAVLTALGGGALQWAAAQTASHPERLRVMSDSLFSGGVILLALAVVVWLWQAPRGQRFALSTLLILTLVDVWRVSQPLVNVQTGQPIIPMWQALAASVPTGDPAQRILPLTDAFWELNGASDLGYYTTSGYESLEQERFATFTELSQNPADNPFQLLGVTHVITAAPDDLLPLVLDGTLEPVAADDFAIYRLSDPPPRVFVATTIEIEPDDEQAQARLMQPDFDPLRTVILPDDPGCSFEDGAGSATLLEYTPNRVGVQVTADVPALLVLTDQWYPGWQASVDGVPADLLRADTVLRAVCVPAGAHTVTFRFRPVSVRRGAWLSGVGWAVWLAAMVATRKRAILPGDNSS